MKQKLSKVAICPKCQNFVLACHVDYLSRETEEEFKEFQALGFVVKTETIEETKARQYSWWRHCENSQCNPKFISNHDVIKYLQGYFHSRKFSPKQADIISLEVHEDSESIHIKITARVIGLIIGANGHRIKDIEHYISEKSKKKVSITPIQHIEWYVP